MYARVVDTSPSLSPEGEISKEDVEKLFQEYAETRDAVMRSEATSGKRLLGKRRLANALLSYAREAKRVVHHSARTDGHGLASQ